MSTNMSTNIRETETIPGISPGVSALVKEEALRWREAASANHWRVLDPAPARTPGMGGLTRDPHRRARAG
jgi:hypothetical protein